MKSYSVSRMGADAWQTQGGCRASGPPGQSSLPSVSPGQARPIPAAPRLPALGSEVHGSCTVEAWIEEF